MSEVEVLAPAGRAEFVRDRLCAINKQHNDLVLENGLLLREYKTSGFYKADGYKTFDDAIDQMHEQGLLDYGARNARHFIAIVDMVDTLGLDSGSIKQIGVSKLREIASIKDPEDQLRLLGEAVTKTVGEVQKEAKRIRDKAAGRDEDPLNPVTLLLTDTQRTFYKECIDKGRLLGSVDENVPEAVVLVDVILADWYAGV